MFKIWLLAIRPKTLILSLCPVVLGTAMALAAGSFNLFLFLMTLSTSFGIQILTNLANDYFDHFKGADTIERKGPIRVVAANLVSPIAMRRAMVICLIATTLCSLFLIISGGFTIACLFLLSILCAFAYTTGPLPLAYVGLGELFVLCFFGPLATGGTYFLQTHTFSWQSFVAGFSTGLIATAVIIVNNLRDISEDRKVQKKTLIVRLGTTFGKCEYLFCLFGGVLSPLFFIFTQPYCLLALILFFPALFLSYKICTIKDPVSLNPFLGKTAALCGLHTFLFSLGWML